MQLMQYNVIKHLPEPDFVYQYMNQYKQPNGLHERPNAT